MPAYHGVWSTLSRMWNEEGWRGFMRGNGTNVIRMIPYSASQFAAYEQCKSVLMEQGKSELDTPRRLVAGAVAGTVSVVCTYPLDLVRTRLSIQSAFLSMSNDTKKLPGIIPTTKLIYKTEGGLRGLYRGLWPTTLVTMMNFFMICTYTNYYIIRVLLLMSHSISNVMKC